jgi:hypothetical protein
MLAKQSVTIANMSAEENPIAMRRRGNKRMAWLSVLPVASKHYLTG